MLSNQELRDLLEIDASLPPAPWGIDPEDWSMMTIGTLDKYGVDDYNIAYVVTRCKACYERNPHDWDASSCMGGKKQTHEDIVKMRNTFREIVEELLELRLKVKDE